MRTVAITGTRDTGHRSLDDYVALFAAYLAPFADGHFYIGGARGIDTLTLAWLAEHTDAHLTVGSAGHRGPAAGRSARNHRVCQGPHREHRRTQCGRIECHHLSRAQ